jgi:predicted outer membrane repeat protein
MKNRFVTGIKPFTIATALLFITAISAHAATVAVTNTNDSGPGSLRAALAAANDFDTIDATGLSGTILLTSGELQVTRNVTINGPGAATLAVDGNATFRVFYISGSPFHNGNVVISGLTITNGLGSSADGIDGGGGIANNDVVGTVTLDNCTVSNNSVGCCNSAGGISNYGSLTISNSIITGNSAQVYDGGGIYNHGALTVSNSTITTNSASRSGGGIITTGSLTVDNSVISDNSAVNGFGGGIDDEYEASVVVTVNNSTISGNSANDGGGGIQNNGGGNNNLTVTNSTISGNSCTGIGQAGGGIGNGATATVINSTISGNSAVSTGGGGMVITGGTLTVKDCTFSSNSAPNGGAIYSWTGGTTQIGDTVLKAGATGGTLFVNTGTITSLGYNLASDNGGGFLTVTGDQINTDPMLGPLQDNGGPTFTQALLPGSPAIDHGNPSFKPPPAYDQRGPGFPRVVNGRIDIGSFEVQAAPAVTTNPATNVASLSATLNGSLDPNGLSTTVYFQYGTTTGYGSATPSQTKTGNTSKSVSANVPGLAASTTYHFRIVATNSGGTTYGSDRTFTTLSPTGPPVVTTNPATNVASFSATLNGSVDPHGLTTTVYFQYGTTISYGFTTPSQTKTGNTYQSVSANVSGLTASTTYHFRIVATNSGGTRYGSDKTFTTLSQTGPPVATTNPATNVASLSATLNGSVDPHGLSTTVHFEYGTTTSYGSTTPSQSKTGNTYESVSANVSGLTASTTYHFRIVATNSGGTTYGSDKTFTTLSPTGPPVVATNPATNVASFSATLNGLVDPHGLSTTVYFQYGTTISYGSTTPSQTKTGNTYESVSANVSGLTTSTTYHFRILATNSGGTKYGSDKTFTTTP